MIPHNVRIMFVGRLLLVVRRQDGFMSVEVLPDTKAVVDVGKIDTKAGTVDITFTQDADTFKAGDVACEVPMGVVVIKVEDAVRIAKEIAESA